MDTLVVCTKCFKSVGKKDGWKRAAVKSQLAHIAATLGFEIEMTGCLDVCPDKGVTVGLAAGKRQDPEATCVLRAKETADEALARFRAAVNP